MKEKREIVAGAGDVINDLEESGSGPGWVVLQL
jgi:hypothetical protein